MLLLEIEIAARHVTVSSTIGAGSVGFAVGAVLEIVLKQRWSMEGC